MNRITRIILSLAAALLLFTVGMAGVSAADAASAVLGEEITLTGTNPVGGAVYFYITGPNVPLSQMKEDGEKVVAYGKKWEKTIDTSKIRFGSGKRPDIGTYTIYISRTDGAASVSDLDSSFTTVPLTLTAPGIYIETAAPTPVRTAEPTPVPVVLPTPEETPVPASPLSLLLIFAGAAAAAGLGMRRKRR
ncbi:MAG TPA: hypothetical protein O0X97_04095 [Methanocorpusculum sp.]|nr:hypothetical protein [Methanocorpusculum sp.]